MSGADAFNRISTWGLLSLPSGEDETRRAELCVEWTPKFVERVMPLFGVLIVSLVFSEIRVLSTILDVQVVSDLTTQLVILHVS